MDLELKHRYNLGPYEVYSVDPKLANQYFSSKLPRIYSSKEHSRVPERHVYVHPEATDHEVYEYLIKDKGDSLGYEPISVTKEQLADSKTKLKFQEESIVKKTLMRDGPVFVALVDAEKARKYLPRFKSYAIDLYSKIIPHNRIYIADDLPTKELIPTAISAILERTLVSEGYDPEFSHKKAFVIKQKMLTASH